MELFDAVARVVKLNKLEVKLVDESLGVLSFLDDALFVVLADRAAQLVIVHGGKALTFAPQAGYLLRVQDLKNSWK